MSDDPDSRSPDPKPTSGEGHPTPFERFEDVLRKVVSVPKSEIPKKRDKER